MLVSVGINILRLS